MRCIGLLSNMLIVLLLTGCWPRNHPDRMDRVEVRAKSSQICFGNNEYREDLERYRTVSIGLFRREGGNNEYRYFIDEKFFTKDLMDNDCFSPFALDLFESKVVYSVFMAYGDGLQANWRFIGLFCIPDKSADPLEILQLSGAMDYLSYCI